MPIVNSIFCANRRNLITTKDISPPAVITTKAQEGSMPPTQWSPEKCKGTTTVARKAVKEAKQDKKKEPTKGVDLSGTK